MATPQPTTRWAEGKLAMTGGPERGIGVRGRRVVGGVVVMAVWLVRLGGMRGVGGSEFFFFN